ncbi:multicomponent Na+:H+ antiporter subunit G [Marinospirillum celere]|uniref:Multicomponent Na+:H+ antiporter subunit G n=1 Tax=Marinospirillum celere TaxID=1122252 RepID=A0A1I1EGJ7_9GAMM|nr:monovalent cation/H(+) antiporter subunit G [Marinospirillum celere]SFB86299.1 multicomponent Na+:H+ antiporter subunit G [Marinospirillum celere]
MMISELLLGISHLSLAFGVGFLVAGTLGLLRFPDVYARLHALTKADTLGLGLVCMGLALQAPSLAMALKYLLIWVLMLMASSIGATLVAGTAYAAGLEPDLGEQKPVQLQVSAKDKP